mmetsp:Transcript_6061/g.18047  ORF Transcript_6061/g.18047 Transcript_6061/m.18047 type:complete len:221 (+) Transcript_6061:53-715(+)
MMMQQCTSRTLFISAEECSLGCTPTAGRIHRPQQRVIQRGHDKLTFEHRRVARLHHQRLASPKKVDRDVQLLVGVRLRTKLQHGTEFFHVEHQDDLLRQIIGRRRCPAVVAAAGSPIVRVGVVDFGMPVVLVLDEIVVIDAGFRLDARVALRGGDGGRIPVDAASAGIAIRRAGSTSRLHVLLMECHRRHQFVRVIDDERQLRGAFQRFEHPQQHARRNH